MRLARVALRGTALLSPIYCCIVLSAFRTQSTDSEHDSTELTHVAAKPARPNLPVGTWRPYDLTFNSAFGHPVRLVAIGAANRPFPEDTTVFSQYVDQAVGDDPNALVRIAEKSVADPNFLRREIAASEAILRGELTILADSSVQMVFSDGRIEQGIKASLIADSTLLLTAPWLRLSGRLRRDTLEFYDLSYSLPRISVRRDSVRLRYVAGRQ